MKRSGPRTPGWVARAAFALALSAALAAPAAAQSRTDVPLKNWGGFAVTRDAVYDDLERLVTAGFADRVVLNTKPMNRMEVARVVATAIRNIRDDTAGKYDDRRDLEAVLDRLREEFRAELAALGVPNGGPARRPAFSFVPVDRAQVRAGYANRDFTWPNNQGLHFEDGGNGGATFETRAQIGSFLSFYVQPEGVVNEEYGAARLASGYAKLTLWNVELTVGRESLWWGPGLNGSTILSNNAPPLDQVRLGTAEAFTLPWIGEWVGPMKLLGFVAQLEERRDHPRALLTGMRAAVTPFSFLELGASRVVMTGGRTAPEPGFGDYLQTLFNPPAGDLRQQPQFRSNNVFALDGDLRIRNVGHYGLPMRDVRLYGEFGWDDTCCGTAFVPLADAIMPIVGVQLINVFGREGFESRFEYARSSRLSFRHDQFRSGYWTRGEVIADYIGSDGESFFGRVTNRLTSNTMLGLELHRDTIGRTVRGFRGPKERATGAAADLSWAFGSGLALFAQYRVADTTNRNFVRGDNGIDHLLRLELTKSFR